MAFDVKKFSFLVHCKWSSWRAWSECSKPCGGGLQERRRTEATRAKNGGNRCVGSSTASQSCNNRDCSSGGKYFSKFGIIHSGIVSGIE